MCCQQVQRIGIQHKGRLGVRKEAMQPMGRLFAKSHAWPDAQCLKTGGIARLPQTKNGFRHCAMQWNAVGLGGPYGYFSGAAAQARLGGQHGATCHSVASRHEQGVTHRSLVRIARSDVQHGGYVLWPNLGLHGCKVTLND